MLLIVDLKKKKKKKCVSLCFLFLIKIIFKKEFYVSLFGLLALTETVNVGVSSGSDKAFKPVLQHNTLMRLTWALYSYHFILFFKDPDFFCHS